MREGLLARFAVLAVLALAVTVFMGKADQQSLQAMDSSLHARLALDVTSQGVVPVLPMEPGFNDHPFTLFYISGWWMRLFGADAWSARFWASLFGVGSVGALIWLGSLLYSGVVGVAAGFILALSLPFISYAARFQLDPAMIFFIVLSFVFWRQRRFALCGISAGVGVWMKSPVSFLVFPSALLALWMTGELNAKEFRGIVRAAILAIFVGSLIWVKTGITGGWPLVTDYWHRQVFGTAVGGRGYQQTFDPFLFTQDLKRKYWPWLPLLLVSLFFIVKQRRWKKLEVALPLSAVLVVLIVISSMRFKFDHYYLPMYPFLALICTDAVRGWLEQKKEGFYTFLLGASVVIPTALLAFPIELSPEMFPALKRFEAVIQSYGDCHDKVLYVDGEQPYGSSGDYGVEVKFYTNREFLSTDCAGANALIASEKPRWILIFGKNRSACLSAENQTRFATHLQFGNQFLLSDLLPRDKVGDLTPLARELRAPLDCGAAPLPKNRYYRYE